MLSLNELAWFSVLAGIALKSTAVLAIAWLVAVALRGQSASARHLVWTAAAIAILLLPLLSMTVPALSLPFAMSLPGDIQFHANASSTNQAIGLPGGKLSSPAGPAPSEAPIHFGWRWLVMLMWILGAAIAVTQMLVAFARMWRIRLSAEPAPYRHLTAQLAEALEIEQQVEVLTIPSNTMPMAFGILRPAVLLPADAVNWSEERRRIVLLHELAHVRRRDMTLQLVARLALAVNWWNPLAWIAWREFIRERERATDDMVLQLGARPSDYATHLLEVAQHIPFTGWASLAMARQSYLETRIAAILDSGLNRRSASRIWTAAAFTVAALIVVPLAALHAQATRPSTIPSDLDATIRAAVAQKNPEMLEDAAPLFESLQQYDAAEKLLTSASAIRETVSGKQSVEYGLSLVRMGDLKSRRGSADEAGAFYTQAAQTLGERPQAAPALIHLGTAAAKIGQLPQALEYFEHARRMSPAQAGIASMWIAVVKQRQGVLDEADALYRDALSQIPPESQEAATVAKLYSDFLRAQGRDEEAKELKSRTTIKKPAAKRADGVYRIGGDVTAPSLLQKVEPVYTDEARLAKLTGTAILSVEIGVDGLAHNAQILQGLGLGLDERSIAAVSQWKFKPGSKSGQPVPVQATIEINWRLM